MKRLLVVASAIMLLGSFGWADATETTPKFAKEGPCKQILQACQSAGYYYGGHKKGPNKGEFLDCLDPILKGQSVAGVAVPPEEVSACNEHRAKRAARKAAAGTTAPAATTSTPAPAH